MISAVLYEGWPRRREDQRWHRPGPNAHSSLSLLVMQPLTEVPITLGGSTQEACHHLAASPQPPASLGVGGRQRLCTGSRGSPESMCAADMGAVMSRTPESQTREETAKPSPG